MRVVSLVPSVTETLRAWGVTPVACTRFCEQADLPTVGGTKDPDVGAITALAPDLVVVDAEENRKEDHDALLAAGVPVHVLHVTSVADLDDQLPALASRLGASWSPMGPLPAPAPTRRAFVPIWRRPWMALGHDTYGASLLRSLGIDSIHGPDDGRYPTTSLDEAARLGADLVVAPSEPYPFGPRHVPELETVAPVLLVDGRDLLWWGTRTTGARARLAAVLG